MVMNLVFMGPSLGLSPGRESCDSSAIPPNRPAGMVQEGSEGTSPGKPLRCKTTINSREKSSRIKSPAAFPAAEPSPVGSIKDQVLYLPPPPSRGRGVEYRKSLARYSWDENRESCQGYLTGNCKYHQISLQTIRGRHDRAIVQQFADGDKGIPLVAKFRHKQGQGIGRPHPAAVGMTNNDCSRLNLT